MPFGAITAIANAGWGNVVTNWTTDVKISPGIRNGGAITDTEKTLYLPGAGERDHSSGQINSQDTGGSYCTSSTSGTSAHILHFDSSVVRPSNAYYYTYGFPVRCVR